MQQTLANEKDLEPPKEPPNRTLNDMWGCHGICIKCQDKENYRTQDGNLVTKKGWAIKVYRAGRSHVHKLTSNSLIMKDTCPRTDFTIYKEGTLKSDKYKGSWWSNKAGIYHLIKDVAGNDTLKHIEEELMWSKSCIGEGCKKEYTAQSDVIGWFFRPECPERPGECADPKDAECTSQRYCSPAPAVAACAKLLPNLRSFGEDGKSSEDAVMETARECAGLGKFCGNRPDKGKELSVKIYSAWDEFRGHEPKDCGGDGEWM